jgi:hypothetical protein
MVKIAAETAMTDRTAICAMWNSRRVLGSWFGEPPSAGGRSG